MNTSAATLFQMETPALKKNWLEKKDLVFDESQIFAEILNASQPGIQSLACDCHWFFFASYEEIWREKKFGIHETEVSFEFLG